MAASFRACRDSREATGFLMSLAFVGLAAVRDVYLGGLLQRVSPLLVAMVAFSLCTLVLLPGTFVLARESLAILWLRSRDLFWVNITSAGAWLAFLYALRFVEPVLVQILYSGIGPLSVVWIERYFSGSGEEARLTRFERLTHIGLLTTLALAGAVALLGHSGAGRVPVGVAAFGVCLAAGGGIAISASTMLCRRLNDAGVAPGALLALRYPATAVASALLASWSPSGLPAGLSWLDALIVTASLLIVIPSYVNQVGIAFASPLTVRVVLASGPVLIFLVQLIEGRLSPSPYSLTAALLYAIAAVSAGLARRRAIRHAAHVG